MTVRFDKFTDRARRVLTLAQEEAQRFNHNYIGTEHLLLGIVREGDGVAAKVLGNLGIKLERVRSAVEYIIGRGETMVMGEIGLTPRAKKVIELAVDEARRLNHHYIGTEHLLLGLVREGEGVAAGVLESFGANLEKIRAQVIQVIDPNASGQQDERSGPRKSRLGWRERIEESPSRISIAMRALHDEPTPIDYLGFHDYAQALADFIRSKEASAPLVIGIDAPWGMGKSSLMLMIRDILSRDQRDVDMPKNESLEGRAHPSKPWPMVWFNAWKYDNEESLWAALTITILSQIREELKSFQKIELWWRMGRSRPSTGHYIADIMKSRIVFLFLGAMVILAILIALAATWDGWPVLGQVAVWSVEPWASWLTGLGMLAVVAMGAVRFAYSVVSGVFEKRVGEFVSSDSYAERVGFLSRFESDFREIVRVATDRGSRPLVVFIDDLDRCSPDKVVEVIESINLLLDADDCVFILGMDMRVVGTSIGVKYRDWVMSSGIEDPGSAQQFGMKFLEKIVQLSFKIPQIDQATAVRFSASVMGQDQDVRSNGADQRHAWGFRNAQNTATEWAHSQLPMEGLAQIDDLVLREAAQEVFVWSFEEHPAVAEALANCIPFLQANPRQIKRFMNLFRLHALVANRRGSLYDNEHRLMLIAHFVLIRLRWPGAIDTLLSERKYLDLLRLSMRSESGSNRDRFLATRIERPGYEEIALGVREYHNSMEFKSLVYEWTELDLAEIPLIIHILGLDAVPEASPPAFDQYTGSTIAVG